ncbi:MAG: cysteine desulfurase [Clostridiales bacterium]|nr:cysteine desulfurase [Clostridiales bacterium]
MVEVYLDNSATTAPCKQAIEAMNTALGDNWGNPSSLHRRGICAQALLDDARLTVAKELSCRSEEVYFTSGGTECNNIAVFGTINAQKRRGKRIVTTSVEHSSIEEPVRFLESQGYDVVKLPVDSSGRFSEKDLMRAVTSDTILVSLMLVNNEVGTVQPVNAARRAVNAAGSPAYIHCDAVQAFGKIKIRVSSLDVDILSISSHKIHGPKGVGALYVKKNLFLVPRTYGGLQEKKLRPGTEPMPLIAGFAAAIKALPNPSTVVEQVSRLRDYLCYEMERMGGITINSPPNSLPYIVNISVDGLNSEPMLNYLSDREIYVSSGSACAKGKKSRVLKAMGLSDDRIASALRISLSRMTTFEEIDTFLMVLDEMKGSLKRRR